MRTFVVFIVLLGMATAIAPLSLAQNGKKDTLNPHLPCQGKLSHPVTFEVDLSVVVTAPYHTKVLKIWFPIPPSDRMQQVSNSKFSTFPVEIQPKIGKEEVFGNQFAYFEIKNPQGGQLIRHRFTIKTHQVEWNVDAAKVPVVKEWPKSFQPYLRGDNSVVVDDRFIKAAKEISGESSNAAKGLSKVMDWLQANMKYDHSKASLTANAEYAFENKTGHCSDYHGLCASFGRSLGFPTRVVYGINPFPKNSPSHCKMEAFIPTYGWVTFDVSETQKLIQHIESAKELTAEKKQKLVAAALQRLRGGFRDNTWFLQTRGTDYDLVPPASRRVSIVRTIYAEADGKALPDPDPSDITQNRFSWMTIHKYTPDREILFPFKNWQSFEKSLRE